MEIVLKHILILLPRIHGYVNVDSGLFRASGAPRGVCKYKFKIYVDERTTQPNLPFRLKPS